MRLLPSIPTASTGTQRFHESGPLLSQFRTMVSSFRGVMMPFIGAPPRSFFLISDLDSPQEWGSGKGGELVVLDDTYEKLKL